MPDNDGPGILQRIRNIGIIAHIDAGKTTVSERFLYYSGKTHRVGDIDDGTTVLDFLEEERERGITITAAAASFDWNGHLIHLIDTPGHIDFTAEVERAIRVIDGAVVIFSGVEGVEAQSEKVWHQSERHQVPKIAFVNKLDRLGASFQRTVEEIEKKFSHIRSVPLQIPSGSESSLSGVADLVSMKILEFSGEDGASVNVSEIPEDMILAASEARIRMLSAVAELSEKIADLFLADAEIPEELLRSEIRSLVIQNKFCPILCGSAKKNIGIQPLLDAVCTYLPSPEDRRYIKGMHPKDLSEVTVDCHSGHFCGLIFKIFSTSGVELYYMRIYSGKLSCNDTVMNPRTGDKIRVKRIMRLYAGNIESIDSAGTGDIIGLSGISNVVTGDTLCSVGKPILLERISFPEPVISMAVEPKSSKDKDKLDDALAILLKEDPTLSIKTHESTGQRIISGMGELHLEISTKRLKDEFRVDIRTGAPRVAYRETIPEMRSICGTCDKVLGELKLSAEVEFTLSPGDGKSPPEISCRHKGQIPTSWVESAETTMRNALSTGGNHGYPLISINAHIADIRSPNEKNAESAVAAAVMDGVRQAVSAGTVMLEPLMKLEVIALEDSIGEINAYLQSRRAAITGLDDFQGCKRLLCEVPLAELFGFSKSLPRLSGGRASFTMEPCGYQPVPPDRISIL